MKINNKGFAISGILYTILILFLLLLASLLALLSMRLNRLLKLTEDINAKVESRNTIEINSLENDKGSSNPISGNKYHITEYRGKYEFTINDTSTSCYSYIPKDTLVIIDAGKLKYKRASLVNGNYLLDTSNLSDLSELTINGCTNSSINKITIKNVYTSQVKF